jgi:hypothetical protein
MELEHLDRDAFLPPPPPLSLALRASTTSLCFRAAGWLQAGARRFVTRVQHALRTWREQPLPRFSPMAPQAGERLTEVLTSLRAQRGWCMAEHPVPISTERLRAAAPTIAVGRRVA